MEIVKFRFHFHLQKVLFADACDLFKLINKIFLCFFFFFFFFFFRNTKI